MHFLCVIGNHCHGEAQVYRRARIRRQWWLPNTNWIEIAFAEGSSRIYEVLSSRAGASDGHQKHFEARATFELFVRHLPPHRNYLVAAGLEQALHFLEDVRFSSEDISYLRSLPLFRHVEADFFEFLARFRFTGDIWALPEGTIFFPGEPLLRVTAPIAEAQLVETSLLSIVHLQTLIAGKAARVTTAAAGRPVIEFGSRRAHGMEASVFAARAAFIGGCEGTSNTYAGNHFGTRAATHPVDHDAAIDA
jgi:nicotinate phosphoribosyltransferase